MITLHRKYNYDESLHEITGEAPPWLIRHGLGLFLGLIIVMFLSMAFVKYPQSADFVADIESKGAVLYVLDASNNIPAVIKQKILPGQKVRVTVDGFDSCSGEIVTANVQQNSVFSLKISLSPNQQILLPQHAAGKVTVLISNRSVLENIMQMLSPGKYH